MITEDYKWGVGVLWTQGGAPTMSYFKTRDDARRFNKNIGGIVGMKTKMFKIFHGQDFMAVVEYKK